MNRIREQYTETLEISARIRRMIAGGKLPPHTEDNLRRALDAIGRASFAISEHADSVNA